MKHILMKQSGKKSRFYSPVITLMIGLILSLQLPMAAQAAMIPTNSVLHSEQQVMDRAGLVVKLQQKELQDKMVQLGVDPAVVIARVKNMTDAEVAKLNEKIQSMPAGGGLVGLLLFLLVLFIITDALGVTDVFTFVKPIQR